MSVRIFVFAHEVTIPPYRSTPPSSYERTYRVVIPPNTPRHLLTSLIKQPKSKDEKISALHLVAHGSPGQLFLSGGGCQPLDAGGCSWFGALRIHFEKDLPRVVIHGCNSASNVGHSPTTGYGAYGLNQSGVGYNFLSAMARATNTIVEGGIHTQTNDASYELEGPRITVGPNGAATGAEYQFAWPGQTL